MSVDTKEMLTIAERMTKDGHIGWHSKAAPILRSAADELDELREANVRLQVLVDINRPSLVAEWVAHDATKRELEELRDLRGAIVRAVRAHEATKRELADKTERLQAAETALREYTGLDTKHAHIAQDYFARYGARKEGT